jgi:D-arabinose 1-dehydrogenase-like Zn-dependent alcohol dehydrogenase
MADEVCWPGRRMVKVDLPLIQAAVLADAVATARHALRLADPAPGSRLCVIGAGGVGSHVVQLARVLHPEVAVHAVVRSRASAARLEAMGVPVSLGLEGAAERLRREGRFETVVDFSGTTTGPAEAVRMLQVGGKLVVGSVVDEPIQLGTTVTGVVTREIQVVGCYISSLADLEEVAALAASGRLDVASSVSRVLPLDRVPEAFRLLEERPAGLVRAVLEP